MSVSESLAVSRGRSSSTFREFGLRDGQAQPTVAYYDLEVHQRGILRRFPGLKSLDGEIACVHAQNLTFRQHGDSGRREDGHPF
jgi:hypothetical protein